ncbi:MAG: EAL domain-containing protein [Methylococcales bacterium]
MFMASGLPKQNLVNLLAAIVMVLALGILIEIDIKNETAHLWSEQQQNITRSTSEIRAKLEAELNGSVHLTSGLESYIKAARGLLSVEQTNAMLKSLVEQSRYISNISIAPGNRIAYIFPRVGNEQAFNLYYPDLPEQWLTIEPLIREHRPGLLGPLPLAQGGSGVIYRIPVFLDEDNYWGMISTVINTELLFQWLEPLAKQQHLQLAMRGRDGLGGRGDVFLGDSQLFQAQSVLMPVSVPGGAWVLAAQSENPPVSLKRLSWLRWLGWALSVLFAGLFYMLSSSYQRQKKLMHTLETSEVTLQQVNAMLQTVINTVPQCVYWKDRTSFYMGGNLNFALQAGLDDESLVGGKCDFDLPWSREQAELHRYVDQRVMQTEIPELGMIEIIHGADGQLLWMRNNKIPLRDRYGKVIGLLGCFEDITSQKKMEEALHLAKNAAESASLAKSRFLSGLSYEMRTPLNAILGYAQLLEINGDISESVAASIKEIRQAGDHLLAIVNDVYDLARIEAGRLEFTIEPIALNTVLAECRAQNQAEAEAGHINLMHETDGNNFWVKVDHRRLLQILNNLLANALKFSRHGGTITLCAKAAPDNKVKITVSDTAVVIASEQMRKLRLFLAGSDSDADAAEKEVSDDPGLGLIIVRQLVKEMHGTLGVDSRQGEGCCFWLEFPMIAPTQMPAFSALFTAQAEQQTAKVLIAEDYGPNQAVLKQQLAKLGYQTDIASDGAAALEMWRQSRYQLVLTDINMPLMDGFALTQAIRQHEYITGKRTFIVAITAAAVPSELKRCLSVGMDEVLTKPLALEALHAVLNRCFGEQQRSSPLLQVDAAVLDNHNAVLELEQLYRVLGRVSGEHASELVDTFILSARQGLAQLRPNENDAVSKEMHKQKSSARTVGAQRYACLAEALEEQAKSGMRVSFVALRKALHDVEVEVARMFADIRKTPSARSSGESVRVDNSYQVLVVDDDPVILQQMTMMLSNLGVDDILTASNGHEALNIIGDQGSELRVLICDLNMPGMDGVELIRLFGKTGYTGGLILMSGEDEKVLNTVCTLAELQGLHVLGQLQKPIAPEQIKPLLAQAEGTLLAKRQARYSPKVTPQSIRDGIATDEFSIWFQPKVASVSLKPIGVEALARWRRVDGNFVPPDLFIAVAERDGLIAELSEILVAKALIEGGRLHDSGFPLKIAVNISAHWLNDLNLPDVILATTKLAGLNAEHVILEVTETGVMEDLTTALDVLTRLRLKGFGLSIDDFGIGYSSFEQLGRIPFTELKLDRSFVSKGHHDATARAILEGSMDMAQKLKLTTIAEGVETQADLELVRSLNCDCIQGYLIAKPMPIPELMDWLKQTKITKS